MGPLGIAAPSIRRAVGDRGGCCPGALRARPRVVAALSRSPHRVPPDLIGAAAEAALAEMGVTGRAAALRMLRSASPAVRAAGFRLVPS